MDTIAAVERLHTTASALDQPIRRPPLTAVIGLEVMRKVAVRDMPMMCIEDLSLLGPS